MTDGADNPTSREALPADYDPRLRRLDALLAEYAAHEQATHPAAADLPQRVFESSLVDLRRGEPAEDSPRRSVVAWRLSGRVLAAAAIIALMLTVSAIMWSRSGGGPSSGPVLLTESDLPELLRDGRMPLVGELQSDYDRRIARTEQTLEVLASADPWTGPTIWGQVDSELITNVEGW